MPIDDLRLELARVHDPEAWLDLLPNEPWASKAANAIAGSCDLPMEYDPKVEHPINDSRADIVRILDDIAKRSVIMEMPEREPVVWPHRRKLMSEADLKIFNAYRRKFKMAEID